MKVTIDAQAFHAAQQSAASKDVRFYLNGVYLAPNGDCVGTDGHTLVFTPNAGNFADIPHRLIRIKDTVPVKAALIELDTDTLIASFLSQALFVLKRVGYETETDDFRYPDYMRTVPKNTGPKEAIGLACEYLERAAKVFRGSKGIRFEFSTDAIGPAILTSAHSQTKMLIMPVRL